MCIWAYELQRGFRLNPYLGDSNLFVVYAREKMNHANSYASLCGVCEIERGEWSRSLIDLRIFVDVLLIQLKWQNI